MSRPLVDEIEAIYQEHRSGKLAEDDALWHLRAVADLTGLGALEILTNPRRPTERYGEVSS